MWMFPSTDTQFFVVIMQDAAIKFVLSGEIRGNGLAFVGQTQSQLDKYELLSMLVAVRAYPIGGIVFFLIQLDGKPPCF